MAATHVDDTAHGERQSLLQANLCEEQLAYAASTNSILALRTARQLTNAAGIGAQSQPAVQQRITRLEDQISFREGDHLDRLKRSCVFLLHKEHRNAEGKALLVSFAQTLPFSQSKGFMDTLTTALLLEVCTVTHASY
jgi:hypothetical protein